MYHHRIFLLFLYLYFCDSPAHVDLCYVACSVIENLLFVYAVVKVTLHVSFLFISIEGIEYNLP